jgi:hypothetical protein
MKTIVELVAHNHRKLDYVQKNSCAKICNRKKAFAKKSLISYNFFNCLNLAVETRFL